METATFIVALILFFAPLFDWTASYILNKASNQADHDNIALKERSRIAVVLACATTLNASLAAIRLFQLQIPPEFAIVVLSISLLLVSVPNLYWLLLYRRYRFRK